MNNWKFSFHLCGIIFFIGLTTTLLHLCPLNQLVTIPLPKCIGFFFFKFIHCYCFWKRRNKDWVILWDHITAFIVYFTDESNFMRETNEWSLLNVRQRKMNKWTDEWSVYIVIEMLKERERENNINHDLGAFVSHKHKHCINTFEYSFFVVSLFKCISFKFTIKISSDGMIPGMNMCRLKWKKENKLINR